MQIVSERLRVSCLSRPIVCSAFNTASAELEAVLILAGAIIPQRLPPQKKKDEDDLSDDEIDDDPSSRMRSSVASTNAKAPKNIRKQEDDDSDFEFDL